VSKTVLHPDWLTSANPDVLLNTLPNAPQPLPPGFNIVEDGPLPRERRRRLLAGACARMTWNFLPTDAQNAIILSERYAEKRARAASLQAAGVRIIQAPIKPDQYAINAAAWGSYAVSDLYAEISAPFVMHCDDQRAAQFAAKALASRAAGPAPSGGSPVAKSWQDTWNRVFAEARSHQAELVRDIFPPPGYTHALHPDWQTSTVMALARQMDESGDFSAVPILADALQDAGCEDEVMLARCRAESGVHCRGNWVVDLILGRE
jgi:hypothetical protein